MRKRRSTKDTTKYESFFLCCHKSFSGHLLCDQRLYPNQRQYLHLTTNNKYEIYYLGKNIAVVEVFKSKDIFKDTVSRATISVFNVYLEVLSI